MYSEERSDLPWNEPSAFPAMYKIYRIYDGTTR